MDIWSGCISIESDSTSIPPLQDLRLSTPPSTTTPTSIISHLTTSLSSSRLSVISLIDPTRIPLFLAAGPSLELTTTSPQTASYFRKLFLSNLPPTDDARTLEQSRIALLVRVTNDTPPPDGSWKVTELAIYGAITHLPDPALLTTTPSKNTADLTPPNSSPPADIPTPRAIVTVHALPLSSHHSFLSHLPRTPAKNHVQIRADTPKDAVFIAPNPQDVLNPSISQSAKKRGAAALDAAADPRKRAKRSVHPRPPPPLSLLGGAALNRRVRAESSVTVKRERSPSPSLSCAPRRSVSGGCKTVVKRRDSTLGERRDSPMERPMSAGRKEVYGEVEIRNRGELARVVVAGMRACGLRDYRGRGKSIVGEEGEDVEKEKEREREKEEYKQVYHHTVKAAAFALRNVISVTGVDTEKMREVVDRLLGMFCEPKTGMLLLEAAGGGATTEDCKESLVMGQKRCIC